MLYRLLPLLLLVLACHPAPTPVPPPPADPAPHWCQPPIVAVSDEFSHRCLDNLAVAVEFWKGVGVQFEDVGLLPAKDMRPGLPVVGLIQVYPRELPPNVLGQAAIARVSPECIAGSEVELAGCDVQTIAHELGHALGLRHVNDPTNLMHPESTGHMGLTDAQREHVR